VIDWLEWLLENESGWVMILGFAGFLAVEFLLDIVHDLVMDWIRERKND